MSNFLYVTLRKPRGPMAPVEELERHVRQRCKGKILHNALERFDVDLVEGDFGLQIDTHLNPSWKQGNREYLQHFVVAIVEWARCYFDEVGLLFLNLRGRDSPEVTESNSSIGELFSRRKAPSNELIVLSPEPLISSPAPR